MSVKRIGKVTGDVCGERVRQIEQRGSLKMRAVNTVLDAIETVRAEMPAGAKIVGAFPHNEHDLPNHHFITVIVEVKAQAAQPLVSVRKRDVRRNPETTMKETCERCDETFELERDDDEPICGACIEEEADMWADVMGRCRLVEADADQVADPGFSFGPPRAG